MWLGVQVLTEGGSPDSGLFVCGWLKRGPSGIIGTNLIDAEQVRHAQHAQRSRVWRGAAPPAPVSLLLALPTSAAQGGGSGAAAAGPAWLLPPALCQAPPWEENLSASSSSF